MTYLFAGVQHAISFDSLFSMHRNIPRYGASSLVDCEQYLMDVFSSIGQYTPKSIRPLDQCQMNLNVSVTSDISNATWRKLVVTFIFYLRGSQQNSARSTGHPPGLPSRIRRRPNHSSGNWLTAVFPRATEFNFC